MVDVPAVDPDVLATAAGGETSAAVRRRVSVARALQVRRSAGGSPIPNAGLAGERLREIAALGEGGERLLLAAYRRLGLSARGFDRIRRVARTIADLDGGGPIGTEHVAEAIQFRVPADLRNGPTRDRP